MDKQTFLEQRMRRSGFTIVVLLGLVATISASSLECSQIAQAGNDQEALQTAKDFLTSSADKEAIVIEEECLHASMRRNYFETAIYLIQEYYSLDPKRVENAEHIIRNAIDQVKAKQTEVVHAIEIAPKGDIPVISPAFQWYQSLDSVLLSIKFATRYDTPGCLDTFNRSIDIGQNQFNMTIFCKIDKQVLKYELDLELFSDIDLDLSYYEFSSVGRLYANLTKKDRPSRWRRLLKQTEKMPNMQLWWEMHDKHEQKLLDHTQFETDEDFMEQYIHVDNTPKKKPKDSKKKKSKDSKKKKQEVADEL